jgi:exonuclease III
MKKIKNHWFPQFKWIKTIFKIKRKATVISGDLNIKYNDKDIKILTLPRNQKLTFTDLEMVENKEGQVGVMLKGAKLEIVLTNYEGKLKN